MTWKIISACKLWWAKSRNAVCAILTFIFFTLMIVSIVKKNIPWFGVLLLVVVLIVLRWVKTIRLDTIVQGALIGVISGMILAFFTNGDYRAGLLAPVLPFINQRYSSDIYTNIKSRPDEHGKYDVEATNILTGIPVKFEGVSLNDLPANIRYSIRVGDNIPPSSVLIDHSK